MSFIETVKKLINIVDWFTQKYENVKEWIKKKYRVHKARRIRNAIDKRNTVAVGKWMRDILKKRQERDDSN